MTAILTSGIIFFKNKGWLSLYLYEKLMMHYCHHWRQKKKWRAFKFNYKTNQFIFWLIHWRPCREDFPTATLPVSTNTEYLLRWQFLLNFSKLISKITSSHLRYTKTLFNYSTTQFISIRIEKIYFIPLYTKSKTEDVFYYNLFVP